MLVLNGALGTIDRITHSKRKRYMYLIFDVALAGDLHYRIVGGTEKLLFWFDIGLAMIQVSWRSLWVFLATGVGPGG